MRGIRTARLSIFNGDTKTAIHFMEKAKATIAAAEKDAPSYDVKTTMSVHGKEVGTTDAKIANAQLVPVDGQIVLAENFAPTHEKKAHVDKANEHLKNGQQKEAIEELRLGEIDVTYTRWWMPIVVTKKHLDRAIKLAQEDKYYESNLALKAIEDGVTVDSVSLTDMAK